MTLKFDVNDNLQNVELYASPRWENDSYSDEFGIVQLPDYASLAYFGDPKWNEDLYNSEENILILNWMNENFKNIDERFCKIFEEEHEECKNYWQID